MKRSQLFIRIVLSLTMLYLSSFKSIAQTYTWSGIQDTVFFNSANWEGAPTVTDLKTAWRNYVIPAGTPNIPCYTENIFGKSGTVQTENITVNNSATFKIYSYTIYTNYASVNGNLFLKNGSLNIRKATTTDVFTAGNANLTMANSTLNTKYKMNIATGTGNVTANLVSSTINAENSMPLTIANSSTSYATINVGQASKISTGGNLTIGTNATINITATGTISAATLTLNGHINLAGLASVSLNGDQKTTMEGWVSDGKISSSEGKNITVTYDATTNKTSAISGTATQWIHKEGAFIVLTNGIVTAKIEETSSKLKSFSVNGIELLAQTNATTANRVGAYHDFTYGSDDSGGFEVIDNTVFSIKESNDDYIDVSFKKTYSGTGIPLDVDIHYVLKKDDNALYTYNILHHSSTYPQTSIGSWRQVFWIANNGSNYTTDKIFVTEKKKWEMPSLLDTWEPTGIAEIIKYTSGVKAGKYDGKYEYTENLMDIPAYGFASDVNHVGLFAVMGSHEYFNGGPTHNDLNAAAGIIHVCMNGVHYGDAGFSVAEGEEWSKIYGPYLIYAPTEATAEENWTKAKERAVTEKNQWPYSWLTNTPEYPLADERGHLTGTLKITDSYKPQVTGKNAWIGLAQLSPDNTKGWELEAKNYQYWVKTDENGNFDISARPGSYTLYAFDEGIIEEYKMDNVTVTGNATNNLGNVEWNLNRTKTLLWEVGVPNRSASEFKMGDLEYSTGFTYEKFRGYFGQNIEYNIAEKNWSDKIPYVHARYPIDDAYSDFQPWVWQLNFNLPDTFNPSTGGNVDLNVGFASGAKAQYWMYVNDRNRNGSPLIHGYPESVESNTYIRQANHGKYSYNIFSIARNKFKPGANTITLVMPSSNGNVSHVMYDYISLAGDNSMVLPITLTSFKVKKDADDVNVLWETSHEENADKYIIERATGDTEFSKIGEVTAKNKAANYLFKDKNPKIGVNYYRLSQIDFDGKITKYSPQSIYIGLNKDEYFMVTIENDKFINVVINDEIRDDKTVIITDISGKTILKKKIIGNKTKINGSTFASGIYIVTVRTPYQSYSKKVVL
ncbi:MAG TPA: polysaccharide lyase family protein [Pelobium sp.]|nr:polysaccharide lyase family protein [Pelobium sp.]